MNALVGYTGFVGSNIWNEEDFEYGFNSQNIKEAYGLKPDLLIYAGLRAEKYIANTYPNRDMELILQAEENIRKISPKKLVLISTIDIFNQPYQVDELSIVDIKNLQPYGFNRYKLENWVREKYPDALIIRLPALFGKNIKKNFIYDYIKKIPFMLKNSKMEELAQKDSRIIRYYEDKNNGFFKIKKLSRNDEKELKIILEGLRFSALNFTDSRSTYQFYNLEHLWRDINFALQHGIQLWHPATEPVSAAEIYQYLTGNQFHNHLDGPSAFYDYRTIYYREFDGKNGYICSKNEVLDDIGKFVQKYMEGTTIK